MSEQPDLVVTTYEAFTSEAGWFKHRRWGVCVLDEGHKIKNHESNVAQALFGIGAQMRIILSGTPLQNNLVECLSFSLTFFHMYLFDLFCHQCGLYYISSIPKSLLLQLSNPSKKVSVLVTGSLSI